MARAQARVSKGHRREDTHCGSRHACHASRAVRYPRATCTQSHAHTLTAGATGASNSPRTRGAPRHKRFNGPKHKHDTNGPVGVDCVPGGRVANVERRHLGDVEVERVDDAGGHEQPQWPQLDHARPPVAFCGRPGQHEARTPRGAAHARAQRSSCAYNQQRGAPLSTRPVVGPLSHGTPRGAGAAAGRSPRTSRRARQSWPGVGAPPPPQPPGRAAGRSAQAQPRPMLRRVPSPPPAGVSAVRASRHVGRPRAPRPDHRTCSLRSNSQMQISANAKQITSFFSSGTSRRGRWMEVGINGQGHKQARPNPHPQGGPRVRERGNSQQKKKSQLT